MKILTHMLRWVLVGLVVGLLGIGNAQAVVIDFDPLPTITNSGGVIHPFDQTFVDGSFRVEAFWYTNTPSNPWGTTDGHFHLGLGANGTNVENQHFNASTELQGLMIRRSDGGAFSLSSLDYQVRSLTSIQGFSSSNVNVLLQDQTLSPTTAVASAFQSFGVGGSVMSSFATLNPSGFGNITSLFLSSSATVTFDNIVLGNPVALPVPGTFLLLGTGLVGLVGSAWQRRKREV